MLNPPLSLFPDDLFACIVDHVARLPSSTRQLSNLSIADRAFTRFCQAHIFKVLRLGYEPGTKQIISKNLAKMGKILDDNSSLANEVHVVKLTISHNENGWIFDDPTFISIVQLLAKSLMPPHKLLLSGSPFIFEDPVLVVGRLIQPFFSRSLTILHLSYCKNVPLTIFLICPGLRKIILDTVKATKDRYDKYPDEQCSGRELPTPECLDYIKSESLVKQMIIPPPRFHTGVILWSKLRVLTLSPYEREDMACLQVIVGLACNTLEDLHLTNRRVWGFNKQLPRAGLVNLRDLSRLGVLTLCALIECDAQKSTVLHNINRVLSTISTSNKVTCLSFDFFIYGEYPFRGCLEEDWVGMCDEVVRISGGKHLKLNLKMTAFPPEPKYQYSALGQDELYERIIKKTTTLSEYPNICTHFDFGTMLQGRRLAYISPPNETVLNNHT